VDEGLFRPRGGHREARQRRSRRHNPDGTMTVVEHLYELRYRLGLALLVVLAGSVIGFIWFAVKIGPIPTLGDLMNRPYCALPASERAAFTGHTCALLQTQPFEAIMIRLKIGIAAGIVLTSPLWLYQIWSFITPGLYAKERKFALIFVTCAAALFAGGAVMAYVVLPEALRVLSNVGGGNFVTALAANEYVSFMLNLLLIFGVSFELPLLVVMLNRVGVLKYEKLRKWRRGIIFGLFVFAAFATPGQDPISMTALAGGLTVLFEIAVQIARLHDRRLAQRRVAEGWDGLSDDEASATPTTGDTPADPVDPVDSASYDDAT
jgi:sec-independent protein translocase protein TatC